MPKVPVGALFREREDWAVFAVAGGRAGLQRAKIGQRNDLEAEVLAGLTESARVILHPSDKIQDGARVKVR